MRVLVSGASGLIGSALVPALRVRGDEVVKLVRRSSSAQDEIAWDSSKGLDPGKLAGMDAVVNLAGKNVATRWTRKAKREILESRVRGTRAIAEAVGTSFRASGKPSVFISASAIGFYGSRGSEILTEGSSSGDGFLAEVVRGWEQATEPARTAGVRVVMPRIGMVLARSGGALAKMLPPFRIGLGGKIGSGEQWMSWITITDLVRVFLLAIDNPAVSGVINAITPNPVRNAEFVQSLGEALHRPAVIPLPAFAVKTLFGQMGEETILGSLRVIPNRLQELNFRFEYPQLLSALERIVG